MRRLTIALLAFASLSSSSIAEEKMQHFPRKEWLAWLQIDLPARFKLDPKSFEGEAKWWAKLDDPDSKLQVEVVSYGYISDGELRLTVPGVTHENYLDHSGSIEEIIAAKAEHKTVGSYFRAKILPKDSEESRIYGYERFIHRKPDQVTVYFLSPTAYKSIFGNCYQMLRFNFPEGTSEEHKKTIDAIIASAEPVFDPRRKWDDEETSATDLEPAADKKEEPTAPVEPTPR